MQDVGIIDLWASQDKVCCTTRNVYGVKYPPDVSDAMKATIMGSALLFDLALVEQQTRLNP